MLLKLIEKDYPLDAAVFYNTGMEFDCIYRLRDEVKPMLSQRNIRFVELFPDTPFHYSMLEKIVTERSGNVHKGYGWCGGTCRWGTTDKVRIISRWKASLHDSVTDYVGIAADETKRFEKAVREDKKLPLAEWGMTEADCLDYCRSKGFSWNENGVDLYSILTRVSCWCCGNKNTDELRNIYHYLPEYWNRLVELQKQIPLPFKSKGISIFDFQKRFRLEDERILIPGDRKFRWAMLNDTEHNLTMEGW